METFDYHVPGRSASGLGVGSQRLPDWDWVSQAALGASYELVWVLISCR